MGHSTIRCHAGLLLSCRAEPSARAGEGDGCRAAHHASTAQPRASVVPVADCYRVAGRGDDRENAGLRHAEVV